MSRGIFWEEAGHQVPVKLLASLTVGVLNRPGRKSVVRTSAKAVPNAIELRDFDGALLDGQTEGARLHVQQRPHVWDRMKSCREIFLDKLQTFLLTELTT